MCLLDTCVYIQQNIRWLSGKEFVCQYKKYGFHPWVPWVRKIPWRRKWQATPVFLPGKCHGRRSLAGYRHRVSKSWNEWSYLFIMHSGTRAHQAPLSIGILQARILKWVAMPSSRGYSNSGIKSRSPALQADSLPSELPEKPIDQITGNYNFRSCLNETTSFLGAISTLNLFFI